ncbi:DUF1223 domain-containing protein [Longibacter salinarum]|uniref:DUF1223 domain-containing protein n=1 Tax=Longibacter salinarum TaxID=1850348 RepID=UPI0015CF801B|nr:DUF1223 domain-containing protein [Longibacter salinarum]
MVGFLLLFGLLILATRPAPPEANAVQSTAVAVVELFTSESCLTCPPADSLLGRIQREAQSHGRPVYTLDFHIGHPGTGHDVPRALLDVFTQRHRRYAQSLGSHIYSPQMIVNGTDVFVGSDEFHARRSVGRVLRQHAPVRLHAHATPRPGGRIAVDVRATGTFTDAVLNIALVTPDTADPNPVHDGLVRAFVSHPLEAEIVVDLTISPLVDISTARVISFAQDAKTLAVLGATEANIE